MMSGSDLDGDEFACCWDSRLFLPKTVEPMAYNDSPDEMGLLPLSILEEEFGMTTNEALMQHFINHAKNDNLGKISMLWLVSKGFAFLYSMKYDLTLCIFALFQDHAIDKGSAS